MTSNGTKAMPRICYNKVRDSYQIKIGNKHLYSCKSKEEAEKFCSSAVDVLPEIQAQHLAIKSGNTLNGKCRDFFAFREQSKPRNLRSIKNAYFTHIESHAIASLPLHQLNNDSVQLWLNSLESKKSEKTGKRLALQTIKNVRNCLAAFCKWLKKARYIKENPCKDLDYEERDPGEKRNTLTLKEAMVLISDQRIPVERRILYKFAIFSGLRAGELNSLKWSDIQSDHKIPHVMVRHGGYSEKLKEFLPTKNGKARPVKLLPLAAEALEEQRKLKKDSVLVFPNALGGVKKHSRCDKRFKSDLEKIGAVGVEPGLTLVFHSLRHTCIHLLLTEFGWSLESAQALAGHSQVTTTQRYSKHVQHLEMQA